MSIFRFDVLDNRLKWILYQFTIIFVPQYKWSSKESTMMFNANNTSFPSSGNMADSKALAMLAGVGLTDENAGLHVYICLFRFDNILKTWKSRFISNMIEICRPIWRIKQYMSSMYFQWKIPASVKLFFTKWRTSHAAES